MKILLILPASGLWRGIGRKKLFNGKTFRFSLLSLLTIAALTPAGNSIRIIDEQIENPPDEEFDIVGISVMTATAPRAYEISSYYRKKGSIVVLGGFHPTLNPAEAQSHADAIVVGHAYGAWQKLISDASHGVVKKIYRGFSMDSVPVPAVPELLPRELMKRNHYLTVNATYATLGCRNSCSFCSINSFNNSGRFLRRIEHVAHEISTFKSRFFMFMDDNLTQDREYALELFGALAGLKKKWVTQASIEIADDPELLSMMSNAGCIGIFTGLETFSGKALKSHNKNIKSPESYCAAVEKIHACGIYVESGIMFGFDTDNRGVFSETLASLEKIGVDVIQASIVTPMPGTDLFKKMEARIKDRNWENYDFKHVVFEPALMSGEELSAGVQWLRREFYTPLRILRRLWRWIKMPGLNFFYPLFLNIAYYGRAKSFKLKGYDPLKYN